MEIYLCHMMFYRVSSMLHLERFIHNNDMLYVATCITTLIGAICFSHVIKYYVFKRIENKIRQLIINILIMMSRNSTITNNATDEE